MKSKTAQLSIVVSILGLLVLTFAFLPKTTSAESRTEALSLKPCSAKTLDGRYAVFGSGTKALGGIGPISVVGAGEFDGEGSVSGSDTASLNGNIFHRTYTGSYQVNENCTGSITFALPPPRNIQAHFDFVIVDDGERAFFIQTDPGTDFRVEVKRQ